MAREMNKRLRGEEQPNAPTAEKGELISSSSPPEYPDITVPPASPLTSRNQQCPDALGNMRQVRTHHSHSRSCSKPAESAPSTQGKTNRRQILKLTLLTNSCYNLTATGIITQDAL